LLREQVDKFLPGCPCSKRSWSSRDHPHQVLLEVSAEEQTRRLQDRINDGRKLWKLSPMDLKSATRWDDYTQARDDMFQASDTAWAPWFMAHFRTTNVAPG
jgi:polyphosphate kinase 2 (PPK2 family)